MSEDHKRLLLQWFLGLSVLDIWVCYTRWLTTLRWHGMGGWHQRTAWAKFCYEWGNGHISIAHWYGDDEHQRAAAEGRLW